MLVYNIIGGQVKISTSHKETGDKTPRNQSRGLLEKTNLRPTMQFLPSPNHFSSYKIR